MTESDAAPEILPSPVSPGEPTRHTLEYSGDAFELALLMLKNLVLSILTFGIYRAWARTNMRRYVWGHVAFMGDRAAYVGTGKELFKGWIKLMILLVVFIVVVKIVTLLIPFAPVLLPIGYVVVFGIATYAGLRYRLSRTMWRQIRFGVDKTDETTNEFLKIYFLGVLFTVLSFGIYFPWFKNNERTYLTNKCRFGSAYFTFDGRSDDYAALFFKSLFFTIITLGLYAPWMIRSLTAYRLEHTQFQGARFSFTLKGGDLFVYALVAYFGTMLSLGLAIPWIYNWGLKTFVGHTHVVGDLDMALIETRASDGSALAEETVLDYDLDLGF